MAPKLDSNLESEFRRGQILIFYAFLYGSHCVTKPIVSCAVTGHTLEKLNRRQEMSELGLGLKASGEGASPDKNPIMVSLLGHR